MRSALICFLFAAALIGSADVRMGSGRWRGASRPWPAHPEMLAVGVVMAGVGVFQLLRSRRERRRRRAEARTLEMVTAFRDLPPAPSVGAKPQEP